MSEPILSPYPRRIFEATQAIFGESAFTHSVEQACRRYERDLEQIREGRGIDALLIAVVGAKGQGKTWVARQFVRQASVRSQMRSGDLAEDATKRLVWVGPVAPERIDAASETYHRCDLEQMADIGTPYVILDTPGITDSDRRAAQLSSEALALAPLKLLVLARDQIRSAANLMLARQIDGSICIPVVTSVEPEEMPTGDAAEALERDLKALRDQLTAMAPHGQIVREILVPDFEISGDEEASAGAFLGALLDRFNDIGLTELALNSSRDERIQAAERRLRNEVARVIESETPHLAAAVAKLNRESDLLPERVLDSLLGNESVLETGVRMRVRARLINDTPLIWFPYRTMMSTLNMTQGAWDRVVLTLAGSVPSLFGALSSWARNARQNSEFSAEVRDGIRHRTQQQVEERLQPVCDAFHRAVTHLRPDASSASLSSASVGMRLTGIEELQSRSQRIFDAAIARHATSGWLVQLYSLLGVGLFWGFMSGPIVVIYRDYCLASIDVLTGRDSDLESFPHPTASLLFTSVILSTLPLAVYCMFVLTWSLSRARVRRITGEIVSEHEQAIQQLKNSNVIRLEFEDALLTQAEFLLNLRQQDG